MCELASEDQGVSVKLRQQPVASNLMVYVCNFISWLFLLTYENVSAVCCHRCTYGLNWDPHQTHTQNTTWLEPRGTTKFKTQTQTAFLHESNQNSNQKINSLDPVSSAAGKHMLLKGHAGLLTYEFLHWSVLFE